MGRLFELRCGSAVEHRTKGHRYYVDGKEGEWGEEVVVLKSCANGSKLRVPLKGFGETYRVTLNAPAGTIIGGWNDAG